MKDHIQPGILNDVPAQSRYLNFSIDQDGDVLAALKERTASEKRRYTDTVFVAFGESFDAFAKRLNRITGTRFSLPTRANSHRNWCPPMLHSHPNLWRLGV